MFDRHQAEIIVMQFTSHSLPVNQSMSVTWDFFYLVPFHQPNPTYAISFDYWPLGCVTSFRCITLEWHICPGQRSKYNTSDQLLWVTNISCHLDRDLLPNTVIIKRENTTFFSIFIL